MKLHLFFADEKLFTVALLRSHKMICCMCQWESNSVTSLPAVFCACSHFQQVCKVSVVVLKLGYTNLIFSETGAKINRQYYGEVLLMQELLPVMCSIAGDVFVFLQDNAPTHCTHDTVKLLCHETPQSLIMICGQPTLLI